MISCDKVDEPFTKKLEIDSTITKTVLLEDYTGHQCVNCPEAGELSHNLKANFKENVVVIAVHAGWFAQPTPSGDFTADYRTEEGEEWNTTFGVSSYPNGMVNRKGFSSGTNVLSIGAWSDAIITALHEPALLDLSINNEYNSASRELSVTVETEFLGNVNKNLKLVVVLTESGIVSPQKNNNAEIGATPVILNYVHDHMLRDCINGTWGTEIASAGTANEDLISKSFTYVIPANFVAENCDVVAFVYDTDTKEVIEAAEGKVSGE